MSLLSVLVLYFFFPFFAVGLWDIDNVAIDAPHAEQSCYQYRKMIDVIVIVCSVRSGVFVGMATFVEMVAFVEMTRYVKMVG